jgi:biotin-dependent carboxylase-like uncharacterized protein
MIKVLSPGFFTSVQDEGRFGYGKFGVPTSGAMDRYSAKLANHILSNKDNDALLEITLGRCNLLFNSQAIISISGADFSPEINNQKVRLNTSIAIHQGDILTFNKPTYGVRCYLAVKGGFQTEVVLNSRSFYEGITPQNRVKKNDELAIKSYDISLIKSVSSVKVQPLHFKCTIIEVYTGPEYNLLNDIQKEQFSKILFTISKENSRMGYILQEHIENDLGSLLTSAVLPGTVQLTPSGKLIILMRDCQVTGGYPRILQLTESSINNLAQKTTGDTFTFKIVSLN